MKPIRYITFIFVLMTMVCGCNGSSPRFQSSDPFYRSSGGRDFLRIPLIKPYDTIKGDEKYGWTIDLKVSPSKEATYYISIKDVKKIAIEKGMILVYTPYKEESAEGLGEKVLYWFVLFPERNTEKGFDNENEFQKYIQDNGLQKPTWLDPNMVFQQFDKTSCLDWIPDCRLSK